MTSVRELKRTFLLEEREGTWRLRRMFATDPVAESPDRTALLHAAFDHLKDAAPCTITVVDELSVRWELTAPSSEWKLNSQE